MGNVRMTFTSQDAQAVRSFMKLKNKQRALKQQQRRLNQSTKKLNKTGNKGTQSWARRVTGMIAGYMGVFAAVNKVKDEVRDLHRVREQAARAGEQTYEGMGSLAQVARGREDMRNLIQQARTSMRETGMKRQEAGKLQFALRSAGMDEYRKLFASLHGMADPTRMLKSTRKLQGALGAQETGTPKELLDKLFVASGVAQATVGKVATGAVKAGKMVSGIGGTDEELLAAMAVGSSGQATVEETANRFKAFSKQLDKEGLGGKGLLGGVQTVQQELQKGKGIYDVLKSQRAVAGYRILRDDMEKISRVRDDITEAGQKAAQSGGQIGERTRRALSLRDMAFGQQVRRKRAERQASLAGERTFASDQLQREAILESLKTTRSRRVERGEISQFRQAFETSFIGHRGGISAQAYVGMSPENMIQDVESKYGRRAAAQAAKSAGLVYNPGSRHHMKPLNEMPYFGRMQQDRLWRMFSMGGVLNRGGGGTRQPTEDAPQGGERPEPRVSEDNVETENGMPSTKVKVSVEDQRSAQETRMAGAAGVE